MASAEVGESYNTSIVIKDKTGTLTDPVSITLTVTLPDLTTATPSVIKDSTGTYHGDYTFTQEGLHKVQWATTSPNTSTTDYVNVTVFRSVVGLDDVKSYINFDSSGGKEDLLRQIMMATTELIEEIVGTCVIRTFTNERVTGRSAQVLKLPHGPLPDDNAITSITSVWNGGPSWTSDNDELIVYPDSATVELASYLPFYLGPWKATYKAGRYIVSQKIQLAALETILDLWASQRPYGMDSLEPGPEETAKWEMMINTYKIPPHAMELLSGEERPGFR